MTQKKTIPTELAKVMSDGGASQRIIGEAFGVSQASVSRKIGGDKK
jgi:predicted transcriptional regulator